MDEVEIVPYDPNWPDIYGLEANEIRRVVASEFQPVIEHFGSTAIPGLSAKPIIDIMLGVKSREFWPMLITPLKGIGYDYWEENPNKDRMFFVKGLPPKVHRTHHVHVLRLAASIGTV